MFEEQTNASKVCIMASRKTRRVLEAKHMLLIIFSYCEYLYYYHYFYIRSAQHMRSAGELPR
jgi:hypothetical protein